MRKFLGYLLLAVIVVVWVGILVLGLPRNPY